MKGAGQRSPEITPPGPCHPARFCLYNFGAGSHNRGGFGISPETLANEFLMWCLRGAFKVGGQESQARGLPTRAGKSFRLPVAGPVGESRDGAGEIRR
jgi:hypothetical protein